MQAIIKSGTSPDHMSSLTFKVLNYVIFIISTVSGNSLMVQLRLHASTAGDMDLVSGQETKIPQAMWCGQKKKEYLLYLLRSELYNTS